MSYPYSSLPKFSISYNFLRHHRGQVPEDLTFDFTFPSFLPDSGPLFSASDVFEIKGKTLIKKREKNDCKLQKNTKKAKFSFPAVCGKAKLTNESGGGKINERPSSISILSRQAKHKTPLVALGSHREIL